MTEHWKTIEGFEGRYDISDYGRIRSRYTNPCTRRVTERFLKPGTLKSGHKFVYLGRGNARYIHRLVLEAFVGPCPDGHETLHGPLGAGENCLSNLRWGIYSQNIREAYTPERRAALSRRSLAMWKERKRG